jgi:hypothetical protein
MGIAAREVALLLVVCGLVDRGVEVKLVNMYVSIKEGVMGS